MFNRFASYVYLTLWRQFIWDACTDYNLILPGAWICQHSGWGGVVGKSFKMLTIEVYIFNYFEHIFGHITIKRVRFIKSRAKFSIWAYNNHKSADVSGEGAPPESARVLGKGIYVGMTEWVYTCCGEATLQTSTA